MQYSIITPKSKLSVTIDLANQIGRGATAQVYSFTSGKREYAAKIYKNPENIDWDKITQMTEFSSKVEFSFTKNHAWPIGIIQENGTNVGFAMPLFDTSKFLSLDHFYDNILKSHVKDKDLLALPNLGLLCKNLANVMAEFHKHKIYLIDVKPQNIAVNLINNEVVLLDCDGFSVPSSDGARFSGNFVSTDYIAPEVMNNNISPTKLGKKQDLYALAVLIFQILNSGIHPFSGQLTAKKLQINTNDEKAAAGLFAYGKKQNSRIKPHKSSRHKLWSEDIKAAIDKTFVEGKRLTALAWAKVFSDIEERKDYAKCDQFPNEASHIRFKGKSCIQCFIDSLENNTKPPKQKTIKPEYIKPRPSPKSGSIGKILAYIVLFIFSLFILNEIFVSNSKKTVTSRLNTSQNISVTCQNTSAGVRNCNGVEICSYATSKQNGIIEFETNDRYKNYVSEAKRRKLSCGVKQALNICDASVTGVKNCSDVRICNYATRNYNGTFEFITNDRYKNYVSEAKRRKLSCGVKQALKICDASLTGVKNCSDVRICNYATRNYNGTFEFITNDRYKNYVSEAKKRKLSCGVKAKNCTDNLRYCSKNYICSKATQKVFINNRYVPKFYKQSNKQYVDEARRRNLSCGVKKPVSIECGPSSTDVVNCNDTQLCVLATKYKNGIKIFDTSIGYKNYVNEVKSRQLSCDVKKNSSKLRSEFNIPDNAYIYGDKWFCNAGYKHSGNKCNKIKVPLNAYLVGNNWLCNLGFKRSGDVCKKTLSCPIDLESCSNNYICSKATHDVFEYGSYEKKFLEGPFNKFGLEANRRNLDCGVKEKSNPYVCSREGDLANCSDSMICWKATIETNDNKILFNPDAYSKPFVDEVKRRKINCGVKN